MHAFRPPLEALEGRNAWERFRPSIVYLSHLPPAPLFRIPRQLRSFNELKEALPPAWPLACPPLSLPATGNWGLGGGRLQGAIIRCDELTKPFFRFKIPVGTYPRGASCRRIQHVPITRVCCRWNRSSRILEEETKCLLIHKSCFTDLLQSFLQINIHNEVPTSTCHRFARSVVLFDEDSVFSPETWYV